MLLLVGVVDVVVALLLVVVVVVEVVVVGCWWRLVGWCGCLLLAFVCWCLFLLLLCEGVRGCVRLSSFGYWCVLVFVVGCGW